MQQNLKKTLRALNLDIRHTLEGTYDKTGFFHPGDLETRLNELGVWRDRPAKPLDELSHLAAEDKAARQVIDAYIAYRAEADVSQTEAVAEFVRESAYNWANRLLALRCMEARGIIDEVILQKEIYGGRSLVHNRLAHKDPEACAGPDEGLFAMLLTEFEERSKELPELFAPASPAIALRPSLPALKRCLALLSGTQKANGQEAAADEVFSAPDALGWAYQYWNTEEKDRVFEKVRTQKGAKIEGADIIPATQLYTEPYMVKFLVQNSLGATWMGIHPDSKLADGWEYYVKDADHAPMIEQLEPFRHRQNGTQTYREHDWTQGMWLRPNPDLTDHEDIANYAISFDGYDYGKKIWHVSIHNTSFMDKVDEFRQKGWQGTFEELRTCLFLVQRAEHGGGEDTDIKAIEKEIQDLYHKICAAWEQEWPQRAPRIVKPVQEITLLDPACGSGHFLLDAFDLLFQMYQEEALLPSTYGKGAEDEVLSPAAIAASILNHNLFGIDIDERAVQIAAAALWMKAKEDAPNLLPEALTSFHYHLVATNIRLPKGKDHLKAFLAKHAEAAPLQPALETIFEGLENVHELGSLVQIEEPVEKELRFLREKYESTRKRGIQANLFEPTVIQGELPLGVGNYEKWKTNLLDQLETHFSEETRETDLGLAFYGESAEKGLSLFSLLAQHYDVITANPPYLFNRNMDEILRSYVTNNYIAGYQDLYTCFIEAFISRVKINGYLAFVTSHTFMFLASYEHLRRLIFQKGMINRLVHYGTGIMKELSNPNALGFCSWIFSPTNQSGVFLDARNLEPNSPYSIFANNRELIFFKTKQELNSMPSLTIAYWMPKNVIDLFYGPSIEDICRLANRTKTGENERFVRYVWEISTKMGPGSDWLLYQKGGDYKTYYGNNIFAIKWSDSYYNYYREDSNCRVTDKEFTCRKALTYNSQGQQFCGRITPPISTYDVSGPALIGDYEKLLLALAVLNSPFGSLIIKSLNGSVNIQSSDVLSVPIPIEDNAEIPFLLNWVEKAIALAENICKGNVNEYSFERILSAEDLLLLQKEFFETKQIITKTVLKLLGLNDREIPFILPCETEYEYKYLRHENINNIELIRNVYQDKMSVRVLCLLGHRWPKQIEANEPNQVWADPDGIIPLTPGLPEPTLQERVGARLSDEFPGGNTAALAREFEEIIEESLEKWLASSFFKHHISQFKKRPIAWQLSSRPANGASGKGKRKGLAKAPAFSSLVYYHKLDHNTLTTLQSQYARPLRQSCETELRTLEGLVLLTPEQSSRRLQLEAWIDELKDFEARLEQCAREGFASTELARIAAKEPLDRWTNRDGQGAHPATRTEFEAQEMRFDLDINDGVRVNIAPLQKFGLLAADVLDAKDLEKAISDRAEWRADERRWCREGKLPKPGWWKDNGI